MAGFPVTSPDLTGSPPVLTGTANVESVIRANSLDQMASPAANVGWNSKRLTGLAAPAANTDAAQALGSLLAQVYYAPAGGTTYTIASTTFAAIDTTNLTISFTPISTQVLVELTAVTGFFAGSGHMGFCLFTHGGTTQVGVHVDVLQSPGTTTGCVVLARILVTGLTAGTSTQLDWAWAVSAGTGLIVAKGIASGTFASTDSGPAVMRVFAA